MSSRFPSFETGYGFDHVVVAVRDLARATEQLQRIGFHVESGGHHPGFGTANALVKLDNGYIELLAVEDAEAARRAGSRRRELVEYLEQHEGGLIGYAITSDSLEAVQRRGGRAEPRLDLPPLDMGRTQPDGSTLRWRLLVPGGSTWCRPWPFIIEWAQPGGPLGVPAGPAHANGASSIASITVGTSSIAEVIAFYRENLGIEARTRSISGRDLGLHPALEVGGCRIELSEVPHPTSPGPLSGTVEGGGVTELRIRVASVEAVRRLLTDRRISATAHGAHRLDVRPDQAAGARVAFVQ